MITAEDRRIVRVWAEMGTIPNDPATLAFAAALAARMLEAVDEMAEAVRHVRAAS